MRSFSAVLLPLPEWPVKATNSPFRTSSESCSSTTGMGVSSSPRTGG